jgi:TrmH family RNA methyltransferase
MRSMVGFGFHDLAVIGDSVDFFRPEVVRSSMGSIFNMRVQYFMSVGAYTDTFSSTYNMFLFLVDSNAVELSNVQFDNGDSGYSLVFGNEGSGLLAEEINAFKNAKFVFIKQSSDIDSLNLAVSASIAMYHFSDSIFKSNVNSHTV